MKYVYSASADAFFPLPMKSLYQTAKTWPSDGVEVDETVFKTYCDLPPEGRIRAGDSKGAPSWQDIKLD